MIKSKRKPKIHDFVLEKLYFKLDKLLIFLLLLFNNLFFKFYFDGKIT